VTFGQNGPKLNRRPIYCSRLYGTLNLPLFKKLFYPILCVLLALVQKKINDDGWDVFTPDMKFPSGFATCFFKTRLIMRLMHYQNDNLKLV
jgi:hypothetical protein